MLGVVHEVRASHECVSQAGRPTVWLACLPENLTHWKKTLPSLIYIKQARDPSNLPISPKIIRGKILNPQN